MLDFVKNTLSSVIQFCLDFFWGFMAPYWHWYATVFVILTVYRFVLRPVLSGGAGSDPVSFSKKAKDVLDYENRRRIGF